MQEAAVVGVVPDAAPGISKQAGGTPAAKANIRSQLKHWRQKQTKIALKVSSQLALDRLVSTAQKHGRFVFTADNADPSKIPVVAMSPVLSCLPEHWRRLSSAKLLQVWNSESWEGACGLQEFAQLLERLLEMDNQPESYCLAMQLLPCFDRDGNGTLSFREVFAGMAMLCAESTRDRISAAFELMDTDQDGKIDKIELRIFLRAIAPVPVSVEELEVLVAKVMTAADSDSDGYITYDEFIAWEGNTMVLLWLDQSAQRCVGKLNPPDEQELAEIAVLLQAQEEEEEETPAEEELEADEVSAVVHVEDEPWFRGRAAVTQSAHSSPDKPWFRGASPAESAGSASAPAEPAAPEESISQQSVEEAVARELEEVRRKAAAEMAERIKKIKQDAADEVWGRKSANSEPEPEVEPVAAEPQASSKVAVDAAERVRQIKQAAHDDVWKTTQPPAAAATVATPTIAAAVPAALAPQSDPPVASAPQPIPAPDQLSGDWRSQWFGKSGAQDTGNPTPATTRVAKQDLFHSERA
eukprot:TRINITY_DN8864_c0_g1_i8.p1 TRINITY_DN8864_c0_g1~~TRINITY_DN8864_c0_g1_i8.p1  ORF type:complete len:526 (-),score=153.50 TRINITY_DN8864_c0_g1_i8:132-1709(-)